VSIRLQDQPLLTLLLLSARNEKAYFGCFTTRM
jgi:hypothetical protein